MDQESDRKHCQGKVTNEEKYDSVFTINEILIQRVPKRPLDKVGPKLKKNRPSVRTDS